MITSVLDTVAEFPGMLRRAVQSPMKSAESWLATAKIRAAGLRFQDPRSTERALDVSTLLGRAQLFNTTGDNDSVTVHIIGSNTMRLDSFAAGLAILECEVSPIVEV